MIRDFFGPVIYFLDFDFGIIFDGLIVLTISRVCVLDLSHHDLVYFPALTSRKWMRFFKTRDVSSELSRS